MVLVGGASPDPEVRSGSLAHDPSQDYLRMSRGKGGHCFSAASVRARRAALQVKTTGLIGDDRG